jgi:hypothetical protein
MSALKTLLAATLSTDWQVVYGSRNAETLAANYVAVIRGAVGDDQLVTMELSRSSEAYVVTIELSGSISGAGDETMQTVTENVFTAKTALEHAIRENATGPDLGLSASGVLQALPLKGWEFIPQADGEAREALVRFGVAVIAQNM